MDAGIEAGEGNGPRVNGYRGNSAKHDGDDGEGAAGGAVGGDGARGHRDGRIELGTQGSVGDEGGARLTVVSNDEMRNHRMALLEPVPFKR